MGVLVQIRDVPADVHKALKARAALEGVSLSEYLRRRLIADTSRPTIEELAQRVEAREPVEGDFDSAELIREIRGPMPGD